MKVMSPDSAITSATVPRATMLPKLMKTMRSQRSASSI